MRVSKQGKNLAKKDQGRGRKRFVCVAGSSITSSEKSKSRHLRKFQTMISSSMRKYIMAFFDTEANLRAPGQLQLDNCTHPYPWGTL